MSQPELDIGDLGQDFFVNDTPWKDAGVSEKPLQVGRVEDGLRAEPEMIIWCW